MVVMVVKMVGLKCRCKGKCPFGNVVWKLAFEFVELNFQVQTNPNICQGWTTPSFRQCEDMCNCNDFDLRAKMSPLPPCRAPQESLCSDFTTSKRFCNVFKTSSKQGHLETWERSKI